MRRHVVLVVALLVAAAAIPAPAHAQFPLDPRALLGRLTAPLRHVLPHPTYRGRSVRRSGREAERGGEDEAPRLGLVGPPAWPTAYEDLIGYTFWPNEYEGEYRQHGFGDIAVTIATPIERRPPKTAEARRRAETTGNTFGNTAPACEDALAQGDWPKAQIEQTVQLDDSQRHALDRLQTTISDGAKSVRKSACRNIGSTSPTGRLEAMVQQLWAVQNAGVVIRGALKDFYESLNDDQKAKFELAAKPSNVAASNKPESNPMGRQACAQNAGDDRLLKQIRQAVRPTPKQKQSFELLGKTAAGMGQYLMASCAQPTPTDPLTRLDTANSRLTAINYAATTLEISLNQFYGSLNTEQRKRFDNLGQ